MVCIVFTVIVQAVDWFNAVASDRLTEKEKAYIPVCEEHSRQECTVRLAIRTIIWDMLLSNNKMSDFMSRQATPGIVSIYHRTHLTPPTQNTQRACPRLMLYCFFDTWDSNRAVSNSITAPYLQRQSCCGYSGPSGMNIEQ